MKVGFIAPQSIAAVNGGVRTQALMTAQHLKNLGVEVVLVSPWDQLNELDIDLYHVFSASIENIGILRQLNALDKKIVLSPVMYSNRSSSTVKSILKGENLVGKLHQGMFSEFRIKQQACTLATHLVPNTLAEASLIIEGLTIPSHKIDPIPNGVEERFKDASPALFEDTYGIKDFILFVGHASSKRKNVYSLLEASKSINHPVVIIESFDQSEYSKQCTQLAESLAHVNIIDALPHDSAMLASAYAACKTFVLPSMFETPGIAAMEAALAGANIVITEKGGTQEYFKDFAIYIDPASTSSIYEALDSSQKKGKNNQLRDHIQSRYVWSEVAKQTLTVYQKVLNS